MSGPSPIRDRALLVVEDSASDAAILRTILEADGYDVTVAGDGAEALGYVTQSSFDAVVSDVIMPGMSGFDLCRTLKSDPSTRDIPVILVTGLDRPDEMIRGLACGADNYIVKPYPPEQLLGRLRGLIGRRDGSLGDESDAQMGEPPAHSNGGAGRVSAVEGGSTQDPPSAGDEAGLPTRFRGNEFVIEADKARTLDYLVSTFEDLLASRGAMAKAHQAVQTAREARRFLLHALDALPAQIAILNPHGEIVARNSAWTRFGEANDWDPQSSDLRANYLDVCDASAAAGDEVAVDVARGLREVLAGERDIFYKEYECHGPHEERWFAVRATRMGEWDPPHVVVSHESITERRRAGDTLTQNEAYYRALIEEGTDVTEILDAEGIVRFASPSVERVMGHAPSKLVGAPALERVHPEDRDRVATVFEELLGEPGGRTSYSCREGHANGGWRWLASEAVNLLDHSAVEGIIVTSRDITDRVEAQDAVSQSEAEFRGFVENSPHGIYRSGVTGRFLTVNRALVDMLGYDSPEDLLSLDLARDVYADKGQRQVLVDRHGDSLEIVAAEEVLWRRKDGEVIFVTLTGRPVLGNDGSVAFFEMIAEDVSDRNRLAEQLRQSQKMEAVGQLTGGIAHHFNNLLTVVVTNAQLLDSDLRAGGAEPPIEVEEILNAGRRGTEMVKQLLAFSRRQTLSMTPSVLGREAEALLPMIRTLLPERIDVHHVVGEEQATIALDSGALGQMLLNLATNARDAMQAGGTLTIETGTVTGELGIGGQGSADGPALYAYVSATDDGSGMAPETVARIFDPFFTTKDANSGTGLGMAMIHGLMEQHHGLVQVESEVGAGTTVRLLFPLLPGQEEATTDDVEDQEALPLGEVTILLVEDEEQLRRSAIKVLERHGCEVVSVVDGREALDLLRGRHAEIDLVLADMVMPNMGGLALRAATEDEGIEARFLFTSGYARPDPDGGDSLREHDVFLQKPWSLDELLDAVRRGLSQ